MGYGGGKGKMMPMMPDKMKPAGKGGKKKTSKKGMKKPAK